MALDPITRVVAPAAKDARQANGTVAASGCSEGMESDRGGSSSLIYWSDQIHVDAWKKTKQCLTCLISRWIWINFFQKNRETRERGIPYGICVKSVPSYVVNLITRSPKLSPGAGRPFSDALFFNEAHEIIPPCLSESNTNTQILIPHVYTLIMTESRCGANLCF